MNFVDTYFRSGPYRHELPFVLGAEVAVTVAAAEEGVTSLRVGESVATADAVGAYAEYCVAPADVVTPVRQLVLFGAASGPVPLVDPQRLNAAGSVYLTRPSRPNFMRTRDAFTWRTNELFDVIASGTITLTISGRYLLKDAAQAHRDLEGRKTFGSVMLMP